MTNSGIYAGVQHNNMLTSMRLRLSVMMFLEFFIWGGWYVTMGTYLTVALKASGTQTGAAYGAVALATIFSPFIVGMIADKYFSAQKFMGVLHLIGAGLLFWSTTITDPNIFFWIILAYSAVYMPTIALANSVAFKQMTAPDKEFPFIRVWGTLGWIVVGLGLGYVTLKGVTDITATNFTFKVSAVASLILGIYAFFLPDTPPTASTQKGISQILGLDALVLLKDRSYLVFFIASILICIPLSFYYSFTSTFLKEAGMVNAIGKMTMGQMSEVLFMLALPFALTRFGIKKILLVAMCAWILRFVCFAYGDAHILKYLFYLGILLHGLCFDFFFVSGMIYTETKAGAGIKSAAQGLITVATYGVGMFIGTNLSGWVADYYKINGVVDWKHFWLFPAGLTAVILIVFLFAFKEKENG